MNTYLIVFAVFYPIVAVKSSSKTPRFVMEKTLASIYLDQGHPASFGGLDAVYRAVKQEGKRLVESTKRLTSPINLPGDTTKEVTSFFLV